MSFIVQLVIILQPSVAEGEVVKVTLAARHRRGVLMTLGFSSLSFLNVMRAVILYGVRFHWSNSEQFKAIPEYINLKEDKKNHSTHVLLHIKSKTTYNSGKKKLSSVQEKTKRENEQELILTS